MTVDGTRRARRARLPRALAWGCAVLLAGCGGSSSPAPGTAVVTLADISGDFASYRVIIDSITLTDTNNTVITPLVTPESVDLEAHSDVAEVLQAPALPAGTYKSATVSLDYTRASIWVSVNGQAVAASALSTTGSPMSTAAVTITFDPNHPLTITAGQSTRLAVGVDLAASNTIDTSTSPAQVTVHPFPVITPAPADASLTRVRGELVTVQSGSSNYIINVRPLIDLVSNFGAVFVNTDAQTYFNINGAAFTGSAGLTALAAMPQGTLVAAFGTLTDLSGVTPGFHATGVYAGTSLSSALEDHVTGVVSSRSGNTVNVRGAAYLSRIGAPAYVNNVPVTVGSATAVSRDGAVVSGLTAQSISVGQQLDVSGQTTVDSAGNLSLDSTAGHARLASTRVWGPLNSATPGSASLDVLSFADFAATGFNFAGTGAAGQDANPAAYLVNTGALDQSATAMDTLLQVDGIASAFGAAPPDFIASVITPGTAAEQRLVIEWVNGGASAPFTSISAAGLVVDLSNAKLGAVHEIRTGPATLDLKSLRASPLITTTGANQNDLRLAIGKSAPGVAVFNAASGFATAVSSAFTGSNTIYRLVAVGQFNSGANTFVASRISVSLE